MQCTLIFDIGKTNKKCFVFDEHFNVIHQDSVQFDEKKDEDGFPCEDLQGVMSWVRNTLKKLIRNGRFKIQKINFSTYGASLVHLTRDRIPTTPFYNYLKPYPSEISDLFYDKFGSEWTIAAETGSTSSGMLNSGFQLFWLKYSKKALFEKISYSLHFPQYVAYQFTHNLVSDYTSIGCHTSLWNYKKKDYHHWVYAEQIDKLLPPIIPSSHLTDVVFSENKLKIGVGIHDSSAALLPYLQLNNEPFLLISTGTWCISLNPFSHEILTKEDLKNDCLNYMRIDGSPVKASRLFLGNEHKIQVEILQDHFCKSKDSHRKLKLNFELYANLKIKPKQFFRFESLPKKNDLPSKTDLSHFQTFEEAYHQLMIELVAYQIESAERAIGNTPIKKVYIDGGFSENDLYVKMLSRYFFNYEIYKSRSPIGSALGAAIVISEEHTRANLPKQFFSFEKIK